MLRLAHRPRIVRLCRLSSTKTNPPFRSLRAACTSAGAFLAFGAGCYLIFPFFGISHSALEIPVYEGDESVPLLTLIRSYLVYTVCSIPALVDNAPLLFQFADLPVIRWITHPLIRGIFFDHFVGGDTAENSLSILHCLREKNKGAILCYSAEVSGSMATSASSPVSGIEFARGDKYLTESLSHKRVIKEIIHCIDVAAGFEEQVSGVSLDGRRTWVAIKLSALLPDASALRRFSAHIISTRPPNTRNIPFPGTPHESDLDILQQTDDSFLFTHGNVKNALTAYDLFSLRELHFDLVRICAHARDKGIRVLIDAEYSWYQPAIDALTLSLTRQFNRLPQSLPPSLWTRFLLKKPNDLASVTNVVFQPVVYGTYQAYLRRNSSHLAHSLSSALRDGYALGVKLVRGAYHPHEVAAHKVRTCDSVSLSNDEKMPPVWLEKWETDECYDGCARVLLAAVKEDIERSDRIKGANGLGVVFGTHNAKSCEAVLRRLVQIGLASTMDKEIVYLGKEVTERLAVGQLYGMSDNLTSWLVKMTMCDLGHPFVIKYIPYGEFSEVMPYLSRRAIENKSVLGDGVALREKKWVKKQIWKKLKNLFFV